MMMLGSRGRPSEPASSLLIVAQAVCRRNAPPSLDLSTRRSSRPDWWSVLRAQQPSPSLPYPRARARRDESRGLPSLHHPHPRLAPWHRFRVPARYQYPVWPSTTAHVATVPVPGTSTRYTCTRSSTAAYISSTYVRCSRADMYAAVLHVDLVHVYRY